jgi:hypothetical protein
MKSGGPDITRVAVAVRVIAPLVALIVNGYVPGVRPVAVVTDSWAVPAPLATTEGLKLHAACPDDSPDRPSVTAPPKPFVLETDTVNVVLPPAATVADDGDTPTVKSGVIASR